SPSADRRIHVDVDPAGYDRIDTPVEVELKAEGRMPVQVVDAVTAASVPFQYEQGTLVFTLPGQVNSPRRFEVYLGSAAPKSSAAPFKVTDDVEWQGQKSFRIETPSATYVYQKEGAA